MEKLELLRDAYKPNEADIQKSIEYFLGLKGIFCWPTHAGQIIPVSRGISDIIGVLPNGRIIAIEVKLPSWRPPKEGTKAFKHYFKQLEFIEKIRKWHGIAFFASSVEEVKDQLEIVRPPVSRLDPSAID